MVPIFTHQKDETSAKKIFKFPLVPPTAENMYMFSVAIFRPVSKFVFMLVLLCLLRMLHLIVSNGSIKMSAVQSFHEVNSAFFTNASFGIVDTDLIQSGLKRLIISPLNVAYSVD